MEFTVSQLTSRLLDKLNRNRDRFTPPDLARAGFPARLIDRVVRVGEERLHESLVKPGSKWSDQTSEGVELAWQTYLRRSEEALILPGEEIRNVTESAVKQLLMAYCNPAEYITELSFGTDSELSSFEIRARLDLAGGSHYLGRTLLRYMEKKQLDRLTKERAKQVLLALDQKLSDAYSSKDWIELLSPLFELGGGTLPAGLIRQVFEYKNPGYMEILPNNTDESELTPEEVIRLLDRVAIGSGPATEGEETEDLRLVKSKGEKEDVSEGEQTLMDQFCDGPEEFIPASGPAGFEEEEENDGAEDEPVLPWVAEEEVDGDAEEDQPVNPWFGEEEENDGAEDEPVLPWVADEEVDGDAEENQPVPDNEPFSNLFEQAGPDKTTGDYRNEPNLFSSEEAEDPGSSDPGSGDEISQEESSSVTPMWKSFLERADEEETPLYSPEETYKAGPAGVPSTPDSPPDLFGEANYRDERSVVLSGMPGESDSDRLARWLKKDEKRYLKKLFKNSRTAYVQALTDLTIFDDWKSAAGYLEREIFVKNNVDLFSETAVDFTDKLHSFFIEFKS